VRTPPKREADSSFILSNSIFSELEIEFEYYKDDFLNRIDFDSYEAEKESRIPSIMTRNIDLTIDFTITIKDDILLDTSLIDWHIN
jgi:hypothetical protein